jgi:hypothetical protein
MASKDKKPEKGAADRIPSLKNRIVDRAVVPAKDLVPHPLNARLHPEPQRRAVIESMERFGVLMDVLVNRTTGYMLNGHLRRDIAAERGESLSVAYVEMTPQEEHAVLAVLDPTGEMALVEQDNLAKLMAEMELDQDTQLAALLSTLLDESVPDMGGGSGSTGIGRPSMKGQVRKLGNKQAQIRTVLYAHEVRAFEETLRMTGEPNRGIALLKICEFYREAHSE